MAKSKTPKTTTASPTDSFINTTVDWQYRSRYDPEFRAKLSAGVFTVVALIGAIGFTITNPMWGWVSLIAVPFVAIIIYYVSRWYAKYDIQSSRVYCTRVLPKNASEAKIIECVEQRQDLQDLSSQISRVNGGYGGYGGMGMGGLTIGF